MAKDEVNESSIPQNAALDHQIALALATRPVVVVPAGFAARVAGRLPSRPALVITPVRYGQRAAVACLFLLLVLMLTFAHQATGNSLYWFSLESIFCAQFATLAVWLVARFYMSASSL